MFILHLTHKSVPKIANFYGEGLQLVDLGDKNTRFYPLKINFSF